MAGTTPDFGSIVDRAADRIATAVSVVLVWPKLTAAVCLTVMALCGLWWYESLRPATVPPLSGRVRDRLVRYHEQVAKDARGGHVVPAGRQPKPGSHGLLEAIADPAKAKEADDAARCPICLQSH